MTYGFENGHTLAGSHLTLKQLGEAELEECGEALFSPDTWFVKTRDLNSPADVSQFLRIMLQRDNACTLVARAAGKIVGISTYHNATPDFTRIEIGFTWIVERWQRTFVNREMKYLMLEYAFNVLRANRIEFCAHPSNAKSNLALTRIGAVFEGTLKRWRTSRAPSTDNGDRNLYRILGEDWPDQRLRFLFAGSK